MRMVSNGNMVSSSQLKDEYWEYKIMLLLRCMRASTSYRLGLNHSNH